MMAASFDVATGEAGRPAELFRKTQVEKLGDGRTYNYDVAADGNRFLLVLPNFRASAEPTVVVLNWFEELAAKSRRPR
jgi:hypothetical protein